MVKGLVGWLGHPLGPPIVVHCSAGKPKEKTKIRNTKYETRNTKITIKIPNPKWRLYWCLIKFYRLEVQLVLLVFSTPLVTYCPSNLLTGSPSPLPTLCEYVQVYVFIQCVMGGSIYRSYTLCIWPDSEPTKSPYHPKQKPKGPQTDKRLPPSPFTGQFLRKAEI